MVFKRYIKKDGKRFGPYYYESYRDKKGIVRKRYVGTADSGKAKNKVVHSNAFIRSLLFIGLIVIILLFIFLGGFYYAKIRLTGLVVNENLTADELNEVLSGNENVIKEFESGNNTHQIRDSPADINTKNENKRMDFNISGGKIRLYFDMMNYSEFVE